MKHKRSYQVLSVIGILLVCIVFVTLLPLAIQIVFELTTHIIGSSMTFSEWSKNDMGIIYRHYTFSWFNSFMSVEV